MNRGAEKYRFNSKVAACSYRNLLLLLLVPLTAGMCTSKSMAAEPATQGLFPTINDKPNSTIGANSQLGRLTDAEKLVYFRERERLGELEKLKYEIENERKNAQIDLDNASKKLQLSVAAEKSAQSKGDTAAVAAESAKIAELTKRIEQDKAVIKKDEAALYKSDPKPPLGERADQGINEKIQKIREQLGRFDSNIGQNNAVNSAAMDPKPVDTIGKPPPNSLPPKNSDQIANPGNPTGGNQTIRANEQAGNSGMNPGANNSTGISNQPNSGGASNSRLSNESRTGEATNQGNANSAGGASELAEDTLTVDAARQQAPNLPTNGSNRVESQNPLNADPAALERGIDESKLNGAVTQSYNAPTRLGVENPSRGSIENGDSNPSQGTSQTFESNRERSIAATNPNTEGSGQGNYGNGGWNSELNTTSNPDSFFNPSGNAQAPNEVIYNEETYKLAPNSTATPGEVSYTNSAGEMVTGRIVDGRFVPEGGHRPANLPQVINLGAVR